MQRPNTASGSQPGLAALGITPAALEDVAPGYLAALHMPSELDRFRARRG
jgi:NADH dehydrogenase